MLAPVAWTVLTHSGASAVLDLWACHACAVQRGLVLRSDHAVDTSYLPRIQREYFSQERLRRMVCTSVTYKFAIWVWNLETADTGQRARTINKSPVSERMKQSNGSLIYLEGLDG